MKFPHITLLLGLLLSAAFAGTDSLRAELDSLNALDYRTPGVLLTGEFRSGVLSSVLDRDGEKHTGINASTEVDIKLQARPTEDTRISAFFRIHQDWQKAHDEGISPVLLDWLSYDGKAWGGRMDFNLGDMRIAYTPLTIYTPLLSIPNEAEIFAARRRDVMAYRHLQDDNGRLLQGLNFGMHSGEVLFFDDLYLQGTLSRLRTQPRKTDINFFDYDDTDRILFAGRGGLALYGVSLGANYVYTFTREEPLKNINNPVNVDPQLSPSATTGTPFLIENVSVFSGTIGVDVARLAGLEGWKINLGGEYAMSKYKTENFYSKRENAIVNVIDGTFIEVDGKRQYIRFSRVGKMADSYLLSFIKEPVNDLDGTALLASLDVYTPSALANAGLNLNFIKNDKDFVSELAQNPVYYTPSNVLNAGAVDLIRGSTLENLYFATYTNDPLTQRTLTGNSSNDPNNPPNSPRRRELLNNNKKAHFLRSGFANSLKTPKELRKISAEELDPSVNLSLPFGLATPNRQGILLKLEGSLLGDKLGLNAFANKIDQSKTKNDSAASYLDAGGGIAVEIGKFIGLSQTIRLNGGYGITRETDGYERSVNRASAGLRVGILPWLSVLGGMELINKDYGSVFAEPVKGKELLWLAGPEFELSRGSYLNLQFGMLNYEFKEGDIANNLDRTLITADVRVKF